MLWTDVLLVSLTPTQTCSLIHMVIAIQQVTSATGLIPDANVQIGIHVFVACLDLYHYEV